MTERPQWFDITGGDGTAWQLDSVRRGYLLKIPPGHYRLIDSWIVEQASLAGTFDRFYVTLLHLAPINGVPAMIKLPGATHEFWVMACCANEPLADIIENCGPARILQPLIFGAQMIASSNTDAMERLKAMLRRVCTGQLRAGIAHRQLWLDAYGTSLVTA
jgi:hypothetical protein